MIQDPVWEQSFPDVGSVVVPVATRPADGVRPVRLSAREARERRAANEERLRRLLDEFGALGFDPVVLGTDDPYEIDQAFLDWAELRGRTRWRALRARGGGRRRSPLALARRRAAARDAPMPTTTLEPAAAHFGDRDHARTVVGRRRPERVDLGRSRGGGLRAARRARRTGATRATTGGATALRFTLAASPA